VKLEAPDGRWDLVVVDEAHKMSATFFGGEIKYTKRYRLGQLLSGLARHYLLMTATPHNGKEEDFQLFMALLDGDRFEGRFRDGVHAVDVTDLMRRMVKEDLLKFDGTPLFPERSAYTVPLQAVGPGGAALSRSDRLCARGIQSRCLEGTRGTSFDLSQGQISHRCLVLRWTKNQNRQLCHVLVP